MIIQNSEKVLNPLEVHSSRLAASSSYRRKPVSRGPDWIPCQARNDGPEWKTIPRSLLQGSSFYLGFIGLIRALRDNLEPSVFSLQPKHLSCYNDIGKKLDTMICSN